MKTAKAAIYRGVNTPFEITEFPITTPPAGYAGLSLIISGVCGTDVHIHRGKIAIDPPKIIGHEFIGKVDQLGEGCGDIKIGDNVIVDIACPCGKCALCESGDDANCINLGVTNGGDPFTAPHFWGGYAEYNYSPAKNLVKIPDDLDPRTVAVYACAGPTVIHAFSLAERANCGINKAKVAVVQGLGPVGTFAVAYLAAMGIENVIALTAGNNPQRESLARQLGATEVLNLDNFTEEELIARIRGISGIGADVVVECSGSVKAVPVGLQFLRNRGTYLIPGQYSNSGAAPILPHLITFNALHLIGSSQYSLCDVAAYLEFIKSNPQLHPVISALITEYPVSDVNRAFDDAKAGKNVKTVLVK